MLKADESHEGFWAREVCEYCGGAMRERKVDLSRKVAGKYVVFEGVPAGVCEACGTRAFSANVLKTIEESAKGRRTPEREETIRVFKL